MRAVLLTLMVLAAALLSAPSAFAGDPVMPLSEVRSDMECEGRSVVRGTDIVTFRVRIIDVVDLGGGNPKILFEASGPAVDTAGIGFGFSGSPIYCRNSAGALEVIGAISESTGFVGEFGNRKALATPMGAIIGERVRPPARMRPASPALRRSARRLLSPLSVSGLTPRVADLVTAAARRAGRPLFAAPAGPRGNFPVQQLAPGASAAVGLSTGDVAISGIGTVAYTDADRVWAFGHPFEGVGRRSLLLQDAYVYDVINNPLGVGEIASYKLAAPGHDLGEISNDALNAVVGRLGRMPTTIPMTVTGRDLDTGATARSSLRIVDETNVGNPSGFSPFTFAGALAVINVGSSVLRSSPARQSGNMCVQVTLRELKKPVGFCNRYVAGGQADDGGFPFLVPQLLAADYAAAAGLIENYIPKGLHVTGVKVKIRLRRGVSQAFLTGASAPPTVRVGDTVPVRLRVRVNRGPRATIPIRLRVPPDVRPGARTLRLTGTAADSIDGLEGFEIFVGEEGGGGGEAGPLTLEELRRQIDGLGRYDGVRGSFADDDEEELREEQLLSGDLSEEELIARLDGRPVYRDPVLRISGSAMVKVRVLPRGRDKLRRKLPNLIRVPGRWPPVRPR